MDDEATRYVARLEPPMLDKPRRLLRETLAERDAALREVERLEYELGRWRQGTANMRVVA